MQNQEQHGQSAPTQNPEQASPAQKSMADRISAATIENYQELLTEICAIKDPILMDHQIGCLAKQIGVSKPALKKSINGNKQKGVSDEAVPKACFPGLVDLVLTDQGQVAYLVIQNGVPTVVDSWVSSEGITLTPPPAESIPFTLGQASNILEHYAKDTDRAVVEEIFRYIMRFSYLPDREWVVIATSILLSYFQTHPDVRYVPVIYFYAVAERGKSRTAKSMLSIMYRGIHMVDLRSTNIFRYAENFGASLFLDCTEIWKSAAKNDVEDVLLGRFEKGPKINRVIYPEKGAFNDMVSYDIFGSTIVATNEPANTIFESRCLTITMPNRPGEYENSTPESGKPLKERLTALRARNMCRLLPQVEPVPGISGRLWDISKPLFQMCQLFFPEGIEPMKDLLLEMVGKKVEVKKGTLEGKIVAAITDIADFEGADEVTFRFDEITRRVNERMPERKQYSPQRLGLVLRSLGIHTKTINGTSRVTINKSELEKLMEQYGLKEAPIVAPPQVTPNTARVETPAVDPPPAVVPTPLNEQKKPVWSRPSETTAAGTQVEQKEPDVESGRESEPAANPPRGEFEPRTIQLDRAKSPLRFSKQQ